METLDEKIHDFEKNNIAQHLKFEEKFFQILGEEEESVKHSITLIERPNGYYLVFTWDNEVPAMIPLVGNVYHCHLRLAEKIADWYEENSKGALTDAFTESNKVFDNHGLEGSRAEFDCLWDVAGRAKFIAMRIRRLIKEEENS